MHTDLKMAFKDSSDEVDFADNVLNRDWGDHEAARNDDSDSDEEEQWDDILTDDEVTKGGQVIRDEATRDAGDDSGDHRARVAGQLDCFEQQLADLLGAVSDATPDV